MAEMLANLQVGFDLNSDKFVSKTKVVKNELNSLSNQSVSPMQMKLQGLSGRFGKLAQTMSSLGPAFSAPAAALSKMSNVTKVLGNNFNKISPIISRVSNVFKQVSFGSISTMVKSLGSSVLSLGGAFSRLGTSIKASGLLSLSGIFSSLKKMGNLNILSGITAGRVLGGSQQYSSIGTGSIAAGTAGGMFVHGMFSSLKPFGGMAWDDIFKKYGVNQKLIKQGDVRSLWGLKDKPKYDPRNAIPKFHSEEEISKLLSGDANFTGLAAGRQKMMELSKSASTFQKIMYSINQIGFFKSLPIMLGAGVTKMAAFLKTGLGFKLVLGALIIPPALFFGFKKLAEWIGKSTEHLDKLAKDAKKLQVPSEALKSWQLMGEYAGFAPEVIETAIKTMNRSLSTAQMGSKRKLMAFDMTGLSIKDIREADNPLAAMESILKRISNLSTSGQKQMALSEIFGPVAAQELLKVIDDIDATMARIKENADLSIYADLSAVEDFQDRVTDLNLQWNTLKDSFKKTIGIPLGEFFVFVAKGAGSLSKYIGHLIALPFRKLGDLYRFFHTEDIDIDKFEKELRDKLERRKKQGYLLSDEEIPIKLEEYLASIQQPLDIYKEKISEVDEMLSRGIITQTDYDLIVEKLKSDIIKISDPIEEYAKQIDLLNKYLDEGIINENGFDIKAKELFETLTNGNEALKLSSELVDKYSGSLSKAMTSLEKLNNAKVGVQLPNGEWLGGLSLETVDSEKKSIMKDLIKSFEEDGDKLKNITNFISSTLRDFQRETIDGLDFSKFKEVLTEELIKEFPATNALDTLKTQLESLTTLRNLDVLPIENYNAAIRDTYDQFTPGRNNLDEFKAKLEGIRHEFDMGVVSASQFGREIMDAVSSYQISNPQEMYDALSMLSNQRQGIPLPQLQEGMMNIFGSLENNAINSVDKINAAMDLLYMGQITRNEAFMMLENIFYDIESQAIELERSLMMEQITPQYFEGKFAPLFGILQRLNSITTFDPSMNYMNLQQEKFQNWQNMMSQNMEAMNSMAEQYPAPWGVGPGIHTMIHPGEGGGGGPEQESSPGMYTASQIKGVLTSAKYKQEDYERETATNTKTLVELFTRITYGHGGIYSLG